MNHVGGEKEEDNKNDFDGFDFGKNTLDIRIVSVTGNGTYVLVQVVQVSRTRAGLLLDHFETSALRISRAVLC